MYDSFALKSGAAFVNSADVRPYVAQVPDGLEVDTGKLAQGVHIEMTERLRTWLIDLRLLRNFPLAYLVPDTALLPAESIRFFHVDPTWVDRLVDGVFSAANTGTVDETFSVVILRLVRQDLDNNLKAMAPGQPAWSPDHMTGMLIRSELVRRWPDMMVRAYAGATDKTTPIAILRCEAISRDILIALFAGVPELVQVREPYVGVRFGVEPKDPNSDSGPYQVDRRDVHGYIHGENPQDPQNPSATPVPIIMRPGRVVDIAGLANNTNPKNSPRMIALHLEQRAYVQDFRKGTDERRGSLAHDLKLPLKLRKGRQSNLMVIAQRQKQMDALEKK